MAKHAIVRPPGASFRKCISAHPEHDRLNMELALKQHAEYVHMLQEVGLDVIQLNPEDALPDACFVEDTVVIHRNKALMTRPAPESRRGEIEGVEDALWDYFELSRTTEPATLEGGDVLHFNDYLISGVTQRSNDAGIQQMRDALDVRVETVEDDSIIHLKSYVTPINDDVVIGTNRYARHPAFDQLQFITIPEEECYASNTLTINGHVIIPHGFQETAKLLKQQGFDVIQLHTSEFAKCEGALTCLSIIF